MNRTLLAVGVDPGSRPADTPTLVAQHLSWPVGAGSLVSAGLPGRAAEVCWGGDLAAALGSVSRGVPWRVNQLYSSCRGHLPEFF